LSADSVPLKRASPKAPAAIHAKSQAFSEASTSMGLVVPWTLLGQASVSEALSTEKDGIYGLISPSRMPSLRAGGTILMAESILGVLSSCLHESSCNCPNSAGSSLNSVSFSQSMRLFPNSVGNEANTNKFVWHLEQSHIPFTGQVDVADATIRQRVHHHASVV